MQAAIEKIRCRVPLRISFAGGGTDVPLYSDARGGAVIGSTIDKYAYSTLTPSAFDDGSVKIRSLDFDLVTVLDSKAKFFDVKYDGRTDLAKAVMKVLKPERAGFEIVTSCDAAPGTGLASSSAVIISMIGALRAFLNMPLTIYDIAEVAYEVERKELGIKGGLQDQYACTFGGFYFIEFRKGATIVNPLRVRQEIAEELESSLLLLDTRVSRSSSDMHAAQASSFGDSSYMATLDTVKQQAYMMKDALLKGDVQGFGELLHESWETKKKVSNVISTDLINKIYDKARQEGAMGGKLLGAGGGGHLLFFIDPENRRKVQSALESLGCSAVPFSFESEGLRSWRRGGRGVRP
jgi:D-glycero-alpha-D-manno-heptose-7-phosphate kinase